MITYTVKILADLSGLSVRTLHYYDKIKLLKPKLRSPNAYRLYGEDEILKLQQILFYKEFGFTLKEIAGIFNDPNFNLITALEEHRTTLISRQKKTELLLKTIDMTIDQLKKGKEMIQIEDLYEGFDKESAEKYQQEAREKFGVETIERSEKSLKKMTKNEFSLLQNKMKECMRDLFELKDLTASNDTVQGKISEFYSIIRSFWGTKDLADAQADAFAGLGQLYLSDERYTKIDNQVQPEFANFMAEAMQLFATRLGK